MTVVAGYYYYRYNGGEKYFSQPGRTAKKNAAHSGKNVIFRFGGKIFGHDRKPHAAKSG